MRAEPALLALMAVGVIAAALWTTGGPGTARAERRDDVRLADLDALHRHLTCLRDAGLVPDIATHSEGCPAPRRADPWTGQPYRVSRVTDMSFRLCASFETTLPRDHWRAGQGFDRDTGCMIRNLPDRP